METVSTGSPTIDDRLLRDFDGRPLGGIPRGRLIEVAGRPCSGVTTFLTQVVANFHSVLWVDGDLSAPLHLLHGDYIVVLTPDETEKTREYYKRLAPLVDCVVIDSWDGLVAQWGPGDDLVHWLYSNWAVGQTTLIATHAWQNAETGLEYTVQNPFWRAHCSLGLFFSKPHEVEVAYSSVCQQGRSVYYDDFDERVRRTLSPGPEV